MVSLVNLVLVDFQDILTELNDILKRTLASAQIPSRLEPVGLSYEDNKRPDGMTLIPWSNGRILSWDATCYGDRDIRDI